MTKSSEMMAAVLAAAQRFDTPDAAMHERVWAVVGQRIDAGDGGPPMAEPTGTVASGGSASWLTMSLVRVLVAIGAVGIGVGAIAIAGDDSDASAVEPVASSPPAALLPSDVAAKQAPASAPLPAAGVTPQRAEVVDSKPRKHTSSRAELDGADSLGAEVELLRRARTAANAGSHGDALAILKEHQRRFPAGKLARERDMSRLRAYCALGKRADAKKLAGSMMARDRSDVLRAKLQKTCAGSVE